MTKTQVESVLAACESANIKKYIFVNDTPTIMKNDETGVIKLLDEFLINIRRPIVTENGYDDNDIEFLGMNIEDVHEVRVIADYEKLKKFTDTLGVSFTEDELKFIIELDKSGVDLEPITGNYITFKFMTKAEYDNASQAKKYEYDWLKKFEMKPLINFSYLTKAEYEELEAEDKASYDELLELYKDKKEKYLAPNQAARIN